MKLLEPNITQTLNEEFLIETLNLNNKTILELGCGSAKMTQSIASNGFDRKVIAYEIDKIQHDKNLKLDIENIKFKSSGAQDIKEEESSVDIVFFFKSFHHIPKEFMQKALDEVKRVLKPNGLVYISEPLFLGEQNELVSIFHNEEQVRIDAFETIKKSVDNNQFKLFKEIFFNTEVSYKNFEDFEKKQMNQTYNENNITKEIKQKVKDRFEYYSKGEEITFLKPFRVDILQKI